MLDIVEVLRKWESQGVSLLPPHDRSTVISALNSTGKKYSTDVVDLYCVTGGMQDCGSDNHFWSFWSLEQLVKKNGEWTQPNILFADFLIDSHFYCFRYDCDESSSVCIDYVNDGTPEIVAGSVREFFDHYLNNPGSLAMFD